MADALTALTAITVFGVSCWDEGTVENIGRSRSSATRTLVCAWNDRVKLATALRGGSASVGSVTTYSAGAAYGDWALFVENVQINGVTGNNGMIVGPNGFFAYKYARLTVTYGSLEYGFGDSSYNPDMVGIDYGIELIHTRQTTSVLKYGDGSGEDVPAEDNPPFPVPTMCFTVPLRNLPKLPRLAIIAASAAPINSATCLGVDPGFLLFDGGKAVHRVNAGRIAWDMDLTFKARSNMKWNSMVAPTGGAVEKTAAGVKVRPVVQKNGGAPLLASSDLNKLLPLGAGPLNALLGAEPPSLTSSNGDLGNFAQNTGLPT